MSTTPTQACPGGGYGRKNNGLHLIVHLLSNVFSAKRSGIFFSIVLAVFYAITAALSQRNGRGGDSDLHYLIAKYSWQHPELLIDQWGKPVYTFFASFPAQLGLSWAIAFNVGIVLLTGYLCMLIAKQLNIRYPWVAMLTCCLSSAMVEVTLSSMTEPIGALFLAGALLLWFKGRYEWAAFIASWLPYARSEGFALLIVFFVASLLIRRWSAIPWLAAGVFVFFFLGILVYNDAFWFITGNPYVWQTTNIYGSGSLFHYIHNYHNVLGAAVLIPFLLGLAWALKKSTHLYDWAGFKQKKNLPQELLLIYGCWMGFFVMHAFIWWQGIWGSYGLTRVFALVAPCAGLMAARGMSWFLDLGYISTRLVNALLSVFVLCLFITPLALKKLPTRRLNEDKEIIRATEWLKSHATGVLCYYNPYLSVLLDRDHFDSKQHVDLNIRALPDVPQGAVIIWDSHYGPNHGAVPLSVLEDSSNYKILTKFTPTKPFTTFNKQPYEIYIFQKLHKP